MNERQWHNYVGNMHGAPAHAPWNLAALNSTERTDVLQHLSEWVHWLVERYALADLIPACWSRHGAMVEELLALHMAWRAAYLDPAAPGNAPLNWMEAFERARVRLQAWNRWGCAADIHRPESPTYGVLKPLGRPRNDNHSPPNQRGNP
jgi:hypothetical protein